MHASCVSDTVFVGVVKHLFPFKICTDNLDKFKIIIFPRKHMEKCNVGNIPILVWDNVTYLGIADLAIINNVYVCLHV